MKVVVSVFGALCCMLAAECASAESYYLSHYAVLPQYNGSLADGGISLYGAVDVGVNYQSVGGKSLLQMQSGGNWTSKIGIFARENLSNGWKAEVSLEGGLQADTGALQTTGTLFNRESWIGLVAEDYGTVRLGKQTGGGGLPLGIDVFGTVGTNSVYTWLGMGVVQTARGVESNADLGRGSTLPAARVDNTLKYISPRFGGFGTELVYAFNETAGAAPHAANQGALLTYFSGPIYLAASYGQVWSSPVQINTGGAFQSVRNDLYGLGIVYDVGSLVLSASFNQYAPKLAGSGIARVYALGAILPSGQHEWRISAVYRDTSGVRDSAGHLAPDSALGVMLGYDYKLSKRTSLYARAGFIRNFGISAILLNNNLLPTQPNGTPVYGTTPVTTSAGISHNF
ncbi:porin [Cupriavidus sp. 8B]